MHVGEKLVKVKKYKDYSQNCPNCGALELGVIVYRQYIHCFFIPIAPDNYRKSEIFCSKCGYQIFNQPLQLEYEKRTKPPLYFFSGLIFVLLLGAGVVLVINPRERKMSEQFVNSPKIGDLYHISKGPFYYTKYYYLKISKIAGDTIFLYHNSLEYDKDVSYFDSEDFFVKNNEVLFLKKELIEMLKKSRITKIDREYDTDFNRLK